MTTVFVSALVSCAVAVASSLLVYHYQESRQLPLFSFDERTSTIHNVGREIAVDVVIWKDFGDNFPDLDLWQVSSSVMPPGAHATIPAVLFDDNPLLSGIQVRYRSGQGFTVAFLRAPRYIKGVVRRTWFHLRAIRHVREFFVVADRRFIQEFTNGRLSLRRPLR